MIFEKAKVLVGQNWTKKQAEQANSLDTFLKHFQGYD